MKHKIIEGSSLNQLVANCTCGWTWTTLVHVSRSSMREAARRYDKAVAEHLRQNMEDNRDPL